MFNFKKILVKPVIKKAIIKIIDESILIVRQKYPPVKKQTKKEYIINYTYSKIKDLSKYTPIFGKYIYIVLSQEEIEFIAKEIINEYLDYKLSTVI